MSSLLPFQGLEGWFSLDGVCACLGHYPGCDGLVPDRSTGSGGMDTAPKGSPEEGVFGCCGTDHSLREWDWSAEKQGAMTTGMVVQHFGN